MRGVGVGLVSLGDLRAASRSDAARRRRRTRRAAAARFRATAAPFTPCLPLAALGLAACAARLARASQPPP